MPLYTSLSPAIGARIGTPDENEVIPDEEMAVEPNRSCPFEIALNCVYETPMKLKGNPMFTTDEAASSLIPVIRLVVPLDMSSSDPVKE
ncbi:hypothetical protein SDC9_85687 [bioreactor metagenome]|uniref:Uncharacterized protein n=1 Tax=bioreactor metagenome TaxID=1076179 RepID=A0A644ZDW5_9ZZZZ